MNATEEQVRELAQAVAQQAQVLAAGLVPEGQRYAQTRRLASNVDLLSHWVGDDRRNITVEE